MNERFENTNEDVSVQQDEEALYEIVAAEMAVRKIKKGLWAKAYAQCEGDPNRTKALYIKLRVQALKDETALKEQQALSQFVLPAPRALDEVELKGRQALQDDAAQPSKGCLMEGCLVLLMAPLSVVLFIALIGLFRAEDSVVESKGEDQSMQQNSSKSSNEKSSSGDAQARKELGQPVAQKEVQVKSTNASKTASAKQAAAQRKVQVKKSALDVMDKENNPKTFKKWGAKGFARINALLMPAAELVAASPGCGEVVFAGLSDMKSVPPSKIVVFVDCSSGSRFYVSEDDVKNSKKVASQDEKARSLSDSEMLDSCREAIKSDLMFPSSLKEKWFGGNVYRAEKGRVVATVEFEAQNALGNYLPHRGDCYFDGGKMIDVQITPN